MSESTPPGESGPESGPEEARLALGVIGGPHGIRGEVRMRIWTQYPERLPQLEQVYFDDETTPHHLRSVRLQGDIAIVGFQGITTRDEAEQLRGKVVRIPIEQAAPLEEDEYYHFQLIGLQVYDEAGNHLGELAEIIETGANDVYVIRDADRRETLIPALKDVVLDIDLDQGRMTIRPLQFYEE